MISFNLYFLSSFIVSIVIFQDCLVESYKLAKNTTHHSNHNANISPTISQIKDRTTKPTGTTTTDTEPSYIDYRRENSTVIAARSLQQYQDEPEDMRIPFWTIAHMINSIEQVENALRAGSNGIEVDISFDNKGYPKESYHGFPCDCGRHCHHREDFVKFVQHISKITFPSGTSNLQLVLLDLKLKDLKDEQKRRAGIYLATILHDNLYRHYFENVKSYPSEMIQPPVRVVVSINHVTDVILIKSFIGYMRQHRLDYMSQEVGFDVGMNDNLTEISDMWEDLNGATFNIWQGDGLTNCANIVRGVERLKEAISIRNDQGHFRKIYFWTADVMYQIRAILRLGLDAILTNQPQRVLQVLEEPEFKFKYRLAVPYDNPFAQFRIQPSAWKIAPPSLGEAVETVSNIKKTSADFVKTIPDGIAAALKKVHNSLKSRE